MFRISCFINKIYQFLRRITMFPPLIREIYRSGGVSTYKIVTLDSGASLSGKNILITGGATGIGLAITKRCLAEGAHVLITGRRGEKLVNVVNELNTPMLKTLVWDVSQVSKLFENLSTALELLDGRIDVLINNAGILNTIQFPYVTEEVWDNIYSVNSKGLFFLTQSLCDIWLKENKREVKKIINISSQGGFVGATYPYRLTKWDVAGLTQGLGIKLACKGIIVNGIAPGIVATDMQPELLSRNDNIYCPHNPLKRYCLPEEIAELAVFLVSDLSNFIVGQTIVCDGGYSIK